MDVVVRWLVFVVLMVTVPVAARPPQSRVPPPEIVRDSESVARSFLRGDADALSARFSPFLTARYPASELRRLAEDLGDRGGALRFIQSPWVRANRMGGLVVVVPIDLERGEIDLLLEWTTEGEPRLLRGLAIRPREPRPSPGNENPFVRRPYPPAPYVKPEAFVETELVLDPAQFESRVRLLAMPREADSGPVPLVVMLPARGTLDVDYSMGFNKPARDLAHGLASRGIAVIRLGPKPLSKVRDLNSWLLDEVRLILQMARESGRFVDGAIYTLGFQEAGLAGFELGRTERWLAGAILLSPPWSVTLEEEIRHQRLLAAAGLVDDLYPEYLDGLKSRDELSQSWPSDLFHDAPFGWWHAFSEIDPARPTPAVHGDTLVLFGSNDYLTTEAIRGRWQALAASNTRLWVRVEEGLTRWMLPGEGTPRTELEDAGQVSAEVVDRVARFVLAADSRRAARKEPRGPIR